MSIQTFLQRFRPQYKTAFYPLFDQAAKNDVDMAELLYRSLYTESLEEREVLFNQVVALQERSNGLKRDINLSLGKNFITPFERSDIHALAASLDDIADYILQATSRLNLFKPEELTEDIKKLAELVLNSTKDVAIVVSELDSLTISRKLTDPFTRVNMMEKEADYIYQKSVAALFLNDDNTPRLIKTIDILSALETATDSCKTTVALIESVLIKSN